MLWGISRQPCLLPPSPSTPFASISLSQARTPSGEWKRKTKQGVTICAQNPSKNLHPKPHLVPVPGRWAWGWHRALSSPAAWDRTCRSIHELIWCYPCTSSECKLLHVLKSVVAFIWLEKIWRNFSTTAIVCKRQQSVVE